MDKPTIILAIAIFMASAPNPDADAVAEMTANFIVPASEYNLQAAELPARQESLELNEQTDTAEEQESV